MTGKFGRLEIISRGEDCWGWVCEGDTQVRPCECAVYSFTWRGVYVLLTGSMYVTTFGRIPMKSGDSFPWRWLLTLSHFLIVCVSTGMYRPVLTCTFPHLNTLSFLYLINSHSGMRMNPFWLLAARSLLHCDRIWFLHVTISNRGKMQFVPYYQSQTLFLLVVINYIGIIINICLILRVMPKYLHNIPIRLG